jgi:uncharacterized membrane protein YfcA
LLAGLIAGVTISVAGGGLLLIYPILLALGVPPISASATGSVAMLPAQFAAACGYFKLLLKVSRKYYLLLIPTAAGTLLGAWLLGRTPNESFENIVPWFVLFATLLIVVQPWLHKWLYSRQAKALEKKYYAGMFVLVVFVVLLLAVYGGYFGAGIGIVLLAFFGLTELTNINQMNALKNVFAMVVNCVSFTYFTHIGLIDWSVVPWLLAGSALGGYLGSVHAARLPAGVIRSIIVVIALGVSGYLFLR